MWRLLAAMRRNFRRSGRVADEGAFGGVGVGLNREVIAGGTVQRSPTRGWLVRGGLAIVSGVIRAPISLLSCIASPNVANGPDGAWVSERDFINVSEMNHLVVDESMRYALFM
ncbi:hypothetical protein MLD38_009091 [Melastoma candidum]|uniref:Uncharacterized protein n=1 Tax=Melastoma candidum TaxID=119954 RepID=A0ACB9RWZ6_9MYRT|nr:hypothetical protein MLD38_009091 [Melastoma candidum]